MGLDLIPDRVPPGMGRATQILHRLDAEDEPIVLSINGKVELTVADDGSVRMLMALVERLELLETLRLASQDLDEGKGLSLEEVKEQARVRYGLSL